MAEKMSAVQGYGSISSVYISFQVLQHIAFRHMTASSCAFLFSNMMCLKSLIISLLPNDMFA